MIKDFKLDTHMHFDLYDDYEDVVEYVEKNKIYTIGVTTLPKIYERYLTKYDNCKYFRVALGLHPELCVKYKEQIKLFSKLVDSTRYIGEIGLDFSSKIKLEQDLQRVIFKEIIGFCKGKNKILSVHTRKAVKEVLNDLSEFDGKVILHWYTGGVKDLSEAIDREYYFSINNQMIKNNSGKNIISKIPVNRLLVESDAPFTRGSEKEYSFKYSEEIFKYLSYYYKVDEKSIRKQIKKNFIELLK